MIKMRIKLNYHIKQNRNAVALVGGAGQKPTKGHLSARQVSFYILVAGRLGLLGMPEGSTWHNARGGSGHVIFGRCQGGVDCS